MAGVTTYSCTRCRPIDTEIIEAYQILTNTSKQVSAQEADRVTAEQGRVTAENERERVFGLDHGTAVADHGIAVADHATAGSDHTTAVADHGTASADHTLAAGDHVTAGDDHIASTSATSRANDAAAAAEHMVDIHQGPPGADGQDGQDGQDGTGITEIEQTVASHANGGQNTVQIRTSDGNSYNVYIKNGSASNGLFPTSSALNTACPSPAVGDFAYVGSGFPADIYVCQTAGTWVDSGEDYDGDNVDLTDYATKAEVNQLEHEVGDKLIALTGISSSSTTAGATTNGDVWYNTSSKLLRKKRTGGYDTVPFEDGAIYACNGMLYIWDGSDLVSIDDELAQRVSDNSVKLYAKPLLRKYSFSGSAGNLPTRNVGFSTYWIDAVPGKKISVTGLSVVSPYMVVLGSDGKIVSLQGINTALPSNAVRFCLILSSLPSGDYRVGQDNSDDERIATLENTSLKSTDLTVAAVSANLANPSDIVDGKYVNSSGGFNTNADWAMIGIPVTPGDTLTFGGFYLGRAGYYAFYNGTTLVESHYMADPNGTQSPVTVTVPAGTTLLYFNIKTDSSPENPYQYLMINEGVTLKPYEPYKMAVTEIDGIPVAGGVSVDVETRLSELEDDVEDINTTLSDGIANIIADLPLSADGAGISTGYAYINSTTGVVTVKM